MKIKCLQVGPIGTNCYLLCATGACAVIDPGDSGSQVAQALENLGLTLRYILLTHGMGAHAMNVPEDLAGQKLERAELFICLPPDWKVGEEGEAWYWPIRWLKIRV